MREWTCGVTSESAQLGVARISSETAWRGAKVLVFLLCLVPLALLVWWAMDNRLGPNPVETVIRSTGIWTLRFLLLTLAVTAVRRLTGLGWVPRFRRMLGLFAFFYALLHFAVYLVLDRALAWEEILRDLIDRPYITIGFAALVLLVPLAITSTRGWVRRLGRHWQQLHRSIYLIAALGVLHFLWLVKADPREPLLYGGLLAGLLVLRVPWRHLLLWIRNRAQRPAGAPRGESR